MKLIDFQEKEIKLVLDFCTNVRGIEVVFCTNAQVTKQLMESLKKEFDINILKEKLKEVRNE